MKLLKTLSLMGLTLAAMNTATMTVIQPAKADLFCYPGEKGCRVDGKVGTSGNDKLGNARDGFIITVSNKTGTTIWVDLRAYYQEKLSEGCAGVGGASCNDPYWRNFGTWKFGPGETALVLNGSDGVIGRNATFKARSNDGRVWAKQVDMGANIGSFTFTFR